jgi:hypothetical protein
MACYISFVALLLCLCDTIITDIIFRFIKIGSLAGGKSYAKEEK